ncbi:hypothetical protein [Sphingobium lignivorans]|uniref:DUF8021 domain-containing protein n=1 Tax=Sphingobium lignivorans TaxID=2735886 RepID=A0ABR6NJD7_9SPHN|nr:hypothetical protein [Sphingobium lignivorans]MBB5986737.1 hypothetical protein [Sphingobium lignivorans]
MKFPYLAGLGAALVLPLGSAQAQPVSCDRACLRSTLDAFLAAVIAKDPARAPLAIGFRQTQNARLTLTDAGVWKTLSSLGPLQRRYFDVVTGNAAFFGIVTDNGTQAVASVRLQVRNGKITEGEWHIAHEGDPGIYGKGSKVVFNLARLAADPPPERVVAPDQRLPRETLVAVVNSYFDGIVAENGRAVLAHGGCTRYENGFPAFGGPLKPGQEQDGFQGKQDCTSGYPTLGGLVAARRYPLIDEEAQVVLASAVFVRKAGDPRRRNHFMEVFGVDAGRIRSVHAAMFYAPPDQPLPNWPPYDGNFPLITNPSPTK